MMHACPHPILTIFGTCIPQTTLNLYNEVTKQNMLAATRQKAHRGLREGDFSKAIN